MLDLPQVQVDREVALKSRRLSAEREPSEMRTGAHSSTEASGRVEGVSNVQISGRPREGKESSYLLVEADASEQEARVHSQYIGRRRLRLHNRRVLPRVVHLNTRTKFGKSQEYAMLVGPCSALRGTGAIAPRTLATPVKRYDTKKQQ